MAWVRLDDQFPDHPKVVAAGPLAGWLHVCGLAYCNRYLTDGFVPTNVAHRLVDFEHIGLEIGGNEMVSVGDDVDCKWMAGVLVEQGIWELVPGGYQIHDYLDYQPSKAEVEAEREQKRKAGEKGGKASGRTRREQAESKRVLEQERSRREAEAQARAKAETKPVPVPNPVPLEGKVEEGLLTANGSKTTGNGLPIEKEMLVTKLLSYVGEHGGDETTGTIRGLARRMSQGELAKLEESMQLSGRRAENRAAYLVGSMKKELEERVA